MTPITKPQRVPFPLFELVQPVPILATKCPVCKRFVAKNMIHHIEEQMDIEHIIYAIHLS